MVKVNVSNTVCTHAGGQAVQSSAYDELKRTALTCLLFEDRFYEKGSDIADRLVALCAKCTCAQVMSVALEAATRYRLRHVPLFLIVQALKHNVRGAYMYEHIADIITRPDQMTDLLALYWRDGKRPLSHQLKKGLALAFQKFDRYQLGKYNRDDPIKLRDVLFLCHPKPKNTHQAEDWKDLANQTLESPETWEVRLSRGDDKKQAFTDLLTEGKLGKLAILRNLRNMNTVGVAKALVKKELLRNPSPMLPFQYLAAAKACPAYEHVIEESMLQCVALREKLAGTTILLVDVSGSMDQEMSKKSQLTLLQAACGIAIMLREIGEDVHIYSFSEKLVQVPARRGMALGDAIINSQPNHGTNLGYALSQVVNFNYHYNRVIVITDEQIADQMPKMRPNTKNYIINIASYQYGVGDKRDWVKINGFSECVLDYIREYEYLTDT